MENVTRRRVYSRQEIKSRYGCWKSRTYPNKIACVRENAVIASEYRLKVSQMHQVRDVTFGRPEYSAHCNPIWSMSSKPGVRGASLDWRLTNYFGEYRSGKSMHSSENQEHLWLFKIKQPIRTSCNCLRVPTKDSSNRSQNKSQVEDQIRDVTFGRHQILEYFCSLQYFSINSKQL